MTTATKTATKTATQNPFQQNLARLIERLGQLWTPDNPGAFWKPDDFEAMGTHLKDATALFNDFVESIGTEVANNSYYTVHSSDFSDTCSNGACDAIATCENIAERMRDERSAA